MQTLTHRSLRINLLLMVFLLAGLFGANCVPAPAVTKTLATTPLGTPLMPSPVPSDTNTPLPLTGKVILVANPAVDPALQSLLAELAHQASLNLEVQPSLPGGQIPVEWKIVVLPTQPAELEPLISTAPGTQFVVFSAEKLEPAANLSVIQQHPDQEAFLAGYVSTMVTPDWRLVALMPSDTHGSQVFTVAFKNGSAYFCGACYSALSPIVSFPLVASLPTGSDLSAWQAAIDELRKNIIYALYISPEINNPDLLHDQAAKKTILIGGQTPPDENRPRWAATIRSDTTSALRQLWPDLLAGKGGKAVDAPILITDIQESLLGLGKQQLVENVRKNLASGQIYPLTIPAQ
ncbi:MAG: hypothetical protein IMZ61_09425 [Planctomycetes bacterium]|nr:hypothetical protein [Planctomycetota bacterium]